MLEPVFEPGGIVLHQACLGLSQAGRAGWSLGLEGDTQIRSYAEWIW